MSSAKTVAQKPEGNVSPLSSFGHARLSACAAEIVARLAIAVGPALSAFAISAATLPDVGFAVCALLWPSHVRATTNATAGIDHTFQFSPRLDFISRHSFQFVPHFWNRRGAPVGLLK